MYESEDFDGAIQIEKSDQCYTCQHRTAKNRICPLLEALSLSIVKLEGDMTVQNCNFYHPLLTSIKGGK